MTLLRVASIAAVLLLSTTASGADAPLKASNGVLVDAAGMTVYTYDKDEAGSGKSSCVAACAKNWPPVKADGSPRPPYSVITRADGSKQLAHGGKPLYTFVKDKKAGDKTGDGVGGVWHVVSVATP
jgi:predicted lipoprotein with Yx(FWY)xxD motif